MNNEYIILEKIHKDLLNQIDLSFKRQKYLDINWNEGLIGLIGERGIGKTYMMLQRIKENGRGFYFSSDNPIIKSIGIFKFVYYLYDEIGLKDFYIDEIHKNKDWTNDIKALYDSIPKVNIVFSGSSSLDLFKGVIDLGRRCRFYNIHTLNFSEYLILFHGVEIPSLTYDDIVNNHTKLSLGLASKFKEKYWNSYVKSGYYPFYAENKMSQDSFIGKIQTILDKIILEDLPSFENFRSISLDKLRKVFYFIANTPPSLLSFSGIAKKIQLDKNIVENAIVLLSKIGLIHLIPKFGNLSDRVRKEYKILLGNPNLYNAYCPNVNVGSLRESIFCNAIRKIDKSEIFHPKSGDFIVQINENVHHFEIGGKYKSSKKYNDNVFIVKDDITISENHKVIPLWLFSLLKY